MVGKIDLSDPNKPAAKPKAKEAPDQEKEEVVTAPVKTETVAEGAEKPNSPEAPEKKEATPTEKAPSEASSTIQTNYKKLSGLKATGQTIDLKHL
jgi:translation initiation factor IF-2